MCVYVCVCVCVSASCVRACVFCASRKGLSVAPVDHPLQIVAAWRLQRRRYVELLHQKRSEFRTARVVADQSHPRHLWRSFCDLLGSGHSPPPDVAASELHHCFDDKVDGVRSATAGADPPTYAPAPVGCELRVFTPVTQADVIALVRSLPDKQCSSDLLPTWLLKINFDVLAPFLCHQFNWSLEHGTVPSSFNHAATQKGRHSPGRRALRPNDI